MSNLVTKHQVSVVRGDELASQYAQLLGEQYGSNVEANVVDAIADLLQFAFSELGAHSHYAIAQAAVMHADAEIELHRLNEPFVDTTTSTALSHLLEDAGLNRIHGPLTESEWQRFEQRVIGSHAPDNEATTARGSDPNVRCH